MSAPSHAFDVSSIGTELTVTIRKEFDLGILAQDWAQALIVSRPGPFKAVRFDLNLVGLVSSTFFAGLVQVYQHYGQQGAAIVLSKPDARVVKNLKILRLDTLFTIEPRDG